MLIIYTGHGCHPPLAVSFSSAQRSGWARILILMVNCHYAEIKSDYIKLNSLNLFICLSQHSDTTATGIQYLQFVMAWSHTVMGTIGTISIWSYHVTLQWTSGFIRVFNSCAMCDRLHNFSEATLFTLKAVWRAFLGPNVKKYTHHFTFY